MDDQATAPGNRPDDVLSCFAQMPMYLGCFEGPDLVVTRLNAMAMHVIGGPYVLGTPFRDVAPEVISQRITQQLERVYATGEPFTCPELRMQYIHPEGDTTEIFVNMVAAPWRHADGWMRGVIAGGQDVTDMVHARRASEERVAAAEQRYARARDVVTTLQEAMLPGHLPVLPRLRLAARYLLAEEDTAAGGDWFDALTLPDGTVALVVGDVVGHGVTASAVMGRLRTVLGERLRSGVGLEAAMVALEAFATDLPGAQAATVNVVVLDPALGHMSYVTAGHPPPLVLSADGTCRRLPSTGGGPLATGGSRPPATGHLEDGAMIFLYTDGIIERPGLAAGEGETELAETVTDTALNRALPHQAPVEQVERVCRQTLELLTRLTGHTDDITLLAAQRIPPAGDFEVVLPATLQSVTDVQYELGQWLLGLGVRDVDEGALQHAVVELFTNAVEHAYREPPPRPEGAADVTVRASLGSNGQVRVDVSDRGRWREPDLGEPNRGNGLNMAGYFADRLTLHKGGDGARGGADTGTTAALHRRLTRPVRVDLATTGRARGAGAGRLVLETAPGAPGAPDHLVASGVVDATTVGRLEVRLRHAARGGTRSVTVDLSGITHLASAGVQVLHELHALTARHDRTLTLYAARGGVAQSVLALAALPHTTRNPSAQ